jgi:hypothetical protein
MAVKFTSRIKEWTADTERKLDVAVLEMATDIHRVSAMLAPRDTGALRSSGRIVRNGVADYSVIFGGSSVPYARRRHYENKKTPSSLRYLERGGDSVSNNVARYLRGL